VKRKASDPCEFSGGVLGWRGGGQDGVHALLPHRLHTTLAPAEELVPHLQISRRQDQLASSCVLVQSHTVKRIFIHV
jgi:hypothetical protein